MIRAARTVVLNSVSQFLRAEYIRSDIDLALESHALVPDGIREEIEESVRKIEERNEKRGRVILVFVKRNLRVINTRTLYIGRGLLGILPSK